MMALAKSLLGNQVFWVAVVITSVVGWGLWQKGNAVKAKAELVAEIEAKGRVVQKLDDAARYNNTLKLSLEMQAEDAEVQARAADQARAKERLAWIRLNKLQREISNVPTSENVPVSPHIERVLDELRSPVAGDAGADRVDGGSNEEPPPVDGPKLSPEADTPAETPVS